VKANKRDQKDLRVDSTKCMNQRLIVKQTEIDDDTHIGIQTASQGGSAHNRIPESRSR
jgi:hypothetical protein